MFGSFKKNYALTLSYLICTAFSLLRASEHSIRSASKKTSAFKKHLHAFCSSLWVGMLFLFGREALRAFLEEKAEGRKTDPKTTEE